MQFTAVVYGKTEEVVMEEKKSALLSKTLWVNLFVAAFALFFPAGKEFISENPQIVAIAFSGINIVLRLVTKKGIQFIA